MKKNILFLFFLSLCINVFSQKHVALILDVVESEEHVPCFQVTFKNVSNETIVLSNNTVEEIRQLGRMVVGKNSVCCFKTVTRAGKPFYGGSFLLDRKRVDIPMNPGEGISFQTPIVGPGMPFGGAISFENSEAKNFSKISCFMEKIVYTASDGQACAPFELESNILDITEYKTFDEDFMNITVRNGNNDYHYFLLISGHLVPKKTEDLETIYNKILKRRGFTAVSFQMKEPNLAVTYNAGTVEIPENFFYGRITPDDYSDLYVYCLMGCKYKSANKPYKLNELGQIEILEEKYPRTYLTHLIAALKEALAIDGTFYKISPAKRQNISSSISHWENQLAQNNCY